MASGNNLLGFHAPTTGGIDKAPERLKELDCETGQIFTKNNRQWKARDFKEGEVEAFIKKANGLKGPIVAHSSYLINLGNPKEEQWEKSLGALKIELQRADNLKIDNLVLHPGLHVGSGEEAGMKRIESGLNKVLAETTELRVNICLETTAGQGTSLGYKLEHLARLKEKVKYPKRISFCLDTCHMFAAGYDLNSEEEYENTMNQVESLLGKNNVKAIHLNDALNPCGSKVDRHTHIGEGKIGETGFKLLMRDSRWQTTPKILETPVGDNWRKDRRKNLKRLRSYLD